MISQNKTDQNVRYRNREIAAEKYFSSYPGTRQKIGIRGGKNETSTIGSARLHVCSHGKKRIVIALKCEGEEEYRFILATDYGRYQTGRSLSIRTASMSLSV